jgi:hypothetical protein
MRGSSEMNIDKSYDYSTETKENQCSTAMQQQIEYLKPLSLLVQNRINIELTPQSWCPKKERAAIAKS